MSARTRPLWRALLLLVAGLAALEYLFGSTAKNAVLSNVLQHGLPPRDGKKDWTWPKRARTRPTAYDNENSTKPHNDVARPAVPPRDSGATNSSDVGVDSVNSSAAARARVAVAQSTQSVRTRPDANSSSSPLCSGAPPNLGPVAVDLTVKSIAPLRNVLPWVRRGGRFAPLHCVAQHKVAIVVPFRDRAEHLAIFLKHMHTVLKLQELDYGIFIVEQLGDKPFNRAKLMNVGFMEAQRSRAGGWHCFVFHDIDLLPLDSRNLYSCPRQPRHMSAAVDVADFKLPYNEIYGGVSSMTTEQFLAVNGYSNKYWGWGGEDDDMYIRLRSKNYFVSRYPMSIARYTMLHHEKQVANPKRFILLGQTKKSFMLDGLSSLKYSVERLTAHPLYTCIMANIDDTS